METKAKLAVVIATKPAVKLIMDTGMDVGKIDRLLKHFLTTKTQRAQRTYF